LPISDTTDLTGSPLVAPEHLRWRSQRGSAMRSRTNAVSPQPGKPWGGGGVSERGSGRSEMVALCAPLHDRRWRWLACWPRPSPRCGCSWTSHCCYRRPPWGPRPASPVRIRDLFSGRRQYGTLGLAWFDIAQDDGIYHQDRRIEDSPGTEAAFRHAASAVTPASP